MRPFFDIQLNAARVKVGDIVFWGGTALDEVQVRALVHDDKRMLELPRALRVQPEIGLQGNLDLDIFRHIDERPATPDRPVKSREFVVVRLYELHEMLSNHVRILAPKRAFKVRVDDALLCNLVLQIVIDKLTVVLRAHSRKARALRLRDSKLFKSVLDVLWNILPLALHLRVRAHISRDFVDVQARNVGPPFGDVELVVDFERVLSEFAHPVGVVLVVGKLRDDFGSQALLVSVKALLLVAEIVGRVSHAFYVKFFVFHVLFLISSFRYFIFSVICPVSFSKNSSSVFVSGSVSM